MYLVSLITYVYNFNQHIFTTSLAKGNPISIPYSIVSQYCFYLEAPQQYTFWMSHLSDTFISGIGVSTHELIQECLIKKSLKMCSDGDRFY